jgi:hypothetical protein
MNKPFIFIFLKFQCIFIIIATNLNVQAQENIFIRSDTTIIQKNQTVNFKDNVFELWSPPTDTIYIEDPFTGGQEMLLKGIDSFPIKMNNSPIAHTKELQDIALPERSLDEYFIDLVLQNKALFNQLPDGGYQINPRHFVVNEVGQIVYYKSEGIQTNRKLDRIYFTKTTKGPEYYKIIGNQKIFVDPKQLDDKLLRYWEEFESAKTAIDKLINDYIESGKIKFEPAEKDGQKCVSLVDNSAHVSVTVKDHQVSVDL